MKEPVQQLNAETVNGKERWSWMKVIFIAVIIVVLIRSFVFTTYTVSGNSMQPNFEDGQHLCVDKLIYRFKNPSRGDVIVFHSKNQEDYIKRVIALPGETVQVQGDEVFVDNKQITEPYIAEEIKRAHLVGERFNKLADFPAAKVPAGTVFVLGDNRPQSKDSRFQDVVGFIPIDQIVGRVEIRFWPLKKISWIRRPDIEVTS